MGSSELYLKGYIYSRDFELGRNYLKGEPPISYINTLIEVAFKVIVFDNQMIMAEEVETKKLFPIILEDENGRFIVKNNDKIIKGKYFIRLRYDKRQDRIIFDTSIKNFDLLSYIEENDMNFFDCDEKKEIDFFTYIRMMADKNVYIFKKIQNLKECMGYRYVSLNDIRKNNDKVERTSSKISNIEEDIRNQNYKRNGFNQNDLIEIKKYSIDLSQIDSDSFIGREKEIKEIVKTIGIKNKSVILVGDSGCGKTALVGEIARNYLDDFLEGRKIFYMNTLSLISGTKYRGDFEDRLNKIIQICEKYEGRMILFFDEIHNLCGLGTSDDNKSNDALNILKPYIDMGKIIIIGATTREEYNKYILPDKAFARRMEKIDIPNFTNDELSLILLAYLDDLENKYNIELDLDDEEIMIMIRELIRITSLNRQKAIDNVKIQNPAISKIILENAFVEALYNKSPFVVMDDIFYAIESHSNLSTVHADEMKNRIGNGISSVRNGRVRKKILNIKDYSLIE